MTLEKYLTKNFEIFFGLIFLSYEKSNKFQPLLNTYFRAFSDLLSPPGDKGLIGLLFVPETWTDLFLIFQRKPLHSV